MTWGQIRLQCAKWGVDIDLDLLDQYIQSRYQRILDAHPWKALEKPGTVTVAGAGTAGTRAIYALPADLKILLEVNNATGNFPLRPYTQQELDFLYPGRPDTGASTIYSIAEDDSSDPPKHQVELYPIPNGATSFPIRYIYNPSTFNPTATSASPLPWIPAHLIIDGVRADILSQKKDYQGMMSYESLFTAGVNEMLRTEIHRSPNAKLSELQRFQGVATFPTPPGRQGPTQG